MEAIETRDVGPFTVEIHYDESPTSPREWTNSGVLWANPGPGNDRGYISSDDREPNMTTTYEDEGFGGVASVLFDADEWYGDGVPLVAWPVHASYLGDPSGRLWLGKRQTAATFDPGAFTGGDVVGLYFVTQHTWEQTQGDGVPFDAIKAESLAADDIETLRQYLCGNVYGFVVRARQDVRIDDDETYRAGDVVESVWGFYDGGGSEPFAEAMGAGVAVAESLGNDAVLWRAKHARETFAALTATLQGEGVTFPGNVAQAVWERFTIEPREGRQA